MSAAVTMGRIRMRIILAATMVGLASHASAEPPREDQSSAGSQIIGYEPMSNREMGALMQGTPGVPSGTASAVAGQTAPKVNPNLPLAYETGIVGEGPYTLGRDDVIQISVIGQPEFSGTFAVGFDGRIQYGIVGDVSVGGLTKQEVQTALEGLLTRYVRTPSVLVTITGYNSKAVYVMGEVAAPGKYIMRGDIIKLREAIIAAGLPTRSAAIRRIVVVKPDLEHPVVRKINFKPILIKGRLEDDIDLHPGEIVYVPETVLSKVTRFLGNLLSPAEKVTTTAGTARRL